MSNPGAILDHREAAKPHTGWLRRSLGVLLRLNVGVSPETTNIQRTSFSNRTELFTNGAARPTINADTSSADFTSDQVTQNVTSAPKALNATSCPGSTSSTSEVHDSPIPTSPPNVRSSVTPTQARKTAWAPNPVNTTTSPSKARERKSTVSSSPTNAPYSAASNGGPITHRLAWKSSPESTILLETGVNIAAEQLPQLEEITQAECQTHVGQDLSLYCESCNAIVSENHAAAHLRDGHSVVARTNAVRKRRKAILDAAKKVSTDLASWDRRLQDLDAGVHRVDAQAREACQQVDKFYHDLAEAMQEEKQRVKIEIQQRRLKTQKSLQSERSRLHSQRHTIHTIQDLGRRIAKAPPGTSSNNTKGSHLEAEILSLDSSVFIGATSRVTAENTDTPVSHITGKLGVSIPDDAVENVAKAVSLQTTVFSTNVDVRRMLDWEAKTVSTPNGNQSKLQFPLQGSDGRPLQVAAVPSDVHGRLTHPDGCVEELQLTLGRDDTGERVCETQALDLGVGGYPLQISSSERTYLTWCGRGHTRPFNRDLCSTSLSLSDDGYAVTANSDGNAVAVGDSESQSESTGRSCWWFTVNWKDRHSIFMGVSRLQGQDPVGWWLRDDLTEEEHALEDKCRTVKVPPVKNSIVCITLDLHRKRIELLCRGMAQSQVLDLPSDCASGAGRWCPYFRLRFTGESITVSKT
eukprot:scpid38119/ scgid19474/ 